MSRPAEAVNAPGLDVERVRADFPILQRVVHGKPLVYLDTAASAHRPLAVIEAVEVLDREVGKVLDALDAAGGAMIVTADHGNCETMVDPATGGPHTAHTTNPVPVILFGGAPGVAQGLQGLQRVGGRGEIQRMAQQHGQR